MNKPVKAVISRPCLIGGNTYNVGDDVEIPEDRVKTLELRGDINDADAIAAAKKPAPAPKKAPKAPKAKAKS